MKFYGDIIIIEHGDPLKPFHRSTYDPKTIEKSLKSMVRVPKNNGDSFLKSLHFVELNLHTFCCIGYLVNNW